MIYQRKWDHTEPENLDIITIVNKIIAFSFFMVVVEVIRIISVQLKDVKLLARITFKKKKLLNLNLIRIKLSLLIVIKMIIF